IGSLSQTSAVRPEFREKLLNAVHMEISHIGKQKKVFSRTWKLAKSAALVLLAVTAIITVFSALHKDRTFRVNSKGHPLYIWEHKGISSLEKISFDAPVLSGKRVYAMKRTGKISSLVALDAATGSEIWNSKESVTGYVSADSMHVFGIHRPSGTIAVLQCFNADTGKRKWAYDPKAPSSACSVPEIVDGSVYWTTGNSLHKINISSGEKEWSRAFSEKGLLSNSVTASGSVLIIAGNVLHELDNTDGNILRSSTLKESSASMTNSPLLAASSSSVCAVLFKTPAWKADLVCFDPSYRKVTWEKEVNTVSHICIADSSVIVRAGNVYAYNTEAEGILLWEHKASGCSPVSVVNNRLYFFNTQGTGSLVVLESKTGSIKSTYILPPSCAGVKVTGHQGIINAHNGVLYSFML
ncbi:PQQ-binding-like beta-propeller repeat protein, partial [Planctomycetota bacterium]